MKVNAFPDLTPVSEPERLLISVCCGVLYPSDGFRFLGVHHGVLSLKDSTCAFYQGDPGQ